MLFGSPRAAKIIDDVCAINGGNEFFKYFKNIYPKKHELKKEHKGRHATFLDLYIDIKDIIFIYKLFDKR